MSAASNDVNKTKQKLCPMFSAITLKKPFFLGMCNLLRLFFSALNP